jgi:nitrate/nitrite transporter NarK
MAEVKQEKVLGETGQPQPQKSGHFGWYSELTKREKLTYWACFGGFGLDAMDATIYALVMPTLIAVVGITKPQAGIIASASLIGTAVGGSLAGIAADRIGRVRVLQNLAGQTSAAVQRMGIAAAENVVAVLTGKQLDPSNVVNSELLGAIP